MVWCSRGSDRNDMMARDMRFYCTRDRWRFNRPINIDSFIPSHTVCARLAGRCVQHIYERLAFISVFDQKRIYAILCELGKLNYEKVFRLYYVLLAQCGALWWCARSRIKGVELLTWNIAKFAAHIQFKIGKQSLTLIILCTLNIVFPYIPYQ